MIKGNRLSDLSLKEREQFYIFLDKYKDNKDILSLIKSRFGLDYNKSSLKYVNFLCNRETDKRNIQKDNELMEKWKVTPDPAKKLNYADYLGDLATHKITESDFLDYTGNIKFC
jgi:hypothetical protein